MLLIHSELTKVIASQVLNKFPNVVLSKAAMALNGSCTLLLPFQGHELLVINCTLKAQRQSY